MTRLVAAMAFVSAIGGASAQEPGKELFDSYCAACHQYDGQAVGEAPPLDGTDWVTGPESRLILIALHGVSGRMEIHGKVFDREMPGFGEILGDADIASLLTYVRRRFGHPSDPIQAETVKAVRAAHANRSDYWMVEELLRIAKPRRDLRQPLPHGRGSEVVDSLEPRP